MGQWKLGYPSSLRNASSVETGKAAYDAWSINALTLSSVEPARSGSSISSFTGAVLTLGTTLIASAWVGGWCKFRSGNYEGEVYRIIANTTSSITLRTFDGETPSFSGISGKYVEFCTGPSTYTFPTGKNPVKEDVSISTEADIRQFINYQGRGIYIPRNHKEDIILKTYMTSQAEFEKLAMLCKWKVSYRGGDALYEPAITAAPMVLECGTHDANHQYLVYCTECKKVREGKGGGLIEVQLYLEQVALSNYRSW